MIRGRRTLKENSDDTSYASYVPLVENHHSHNMDPKTFPETGLKRPPDYLST